MPLSDMQCRTAKPKLKAYKLSDFEGLYLEVMPSGSKLWRLKYRLHKKEKRISFGMYPDVSLAEAREKKIAAKAQIKTGSDPVLSRLEAQQTAAFAAADTFEKIAVEWHCKQLAKWKPRYAQTIMHRLEKYVFPHIGDYPLNMIKSIIILSCLQKIEITAPEIARRVNQYIHQVFLYAIATARAENDPTYGLTNALLKYRKKHFASISVDQLPKFLLDLNEHKARLSRQTFLAIKLMLLTFVRTSELIKATWSEIDFEKSLWTIPADRMKMKRPHLVPLSKQSIRILLELQELNGNRNYIFPSMPRPRKHMSNGTILVALGRMKYQHKMTGHGFRALAMGILKEKLGYSHELIDRQLAHAPKSQTDKAYDRAFLLPQRTEMMQTYGDYIDRVYLEEHNKGVNCSNLP
jgi:integrase